MSTDNFIDEEDDFGDFGGFEAAEPIDPQQAQPIPEGIQASPSPWALFPGATQQGQTIEKESKIEKESNIEAQLVQGDLKVPAKTTSGGNFEGDGDTFKEFQTSNQAEAIGTSSASAAAAEDFAADFSQIGASSDKKNKLVGAFDDALAETEADASTSNSPSSEETKSSVNADSNAQIKANNEAAKHLSRIQDKLRLTEQDRTKLQKELEEVQGLQKQLQGELVQLHEQTARYEQMQSKHAIQLDEMRKAGHDALVLIVEEYKELCKTAVLQQQESSQRDFQEYLKQQSENEEMKQRQREDEVSKALESERSKFEKLLQEELSKLEEKHKTELQTAIAAENKKAEELLQEAIESEKEKATAAIETATEEERKRSQQVLNVQKTDLLKLLSEERENSKQALSKSLEEERDQFKESIKDAVEKERERGEKIQKQIRDQIKTELEHYVQKQKQEDLLVRKRQLTSMDIFLESARGQLKLLMTDADALTESS